MGYFLKLHPESTVNKLLIKVFASYILILIIGLIILTFMQVSNSKENINEELQSIGEFASRKLEIAIQERRIDKIQAIYDDLERLNFVGEVYFYNFTKNSVFENIKHHPFENIDSSKIFFEKKLEAIEHSTGKKIEATFRIESSNQLVFEKIKSALLSIYGLAVLKTIIMIILLSWVFKKYLSFKLNILVEKFNKIDLHHVKNNESHKENIKLNCKDIELKTLEEKFNELLDELINSQKELSELNNSLDEKIQERTKQLELLSITDELTKTYNRRFLNETINKELHRARRDKKDFTFAIMDIDNFKLYNDTYGHAKGDEVLRQTSAVLLNKFKRASDYVFRMGGEEFGIIFIELSYEQAANFLNLAIDEIRNLEIEHSKNTAGKYLTASMGSVTIEYSKGEVNIKFNEIYKQADELLYKSKENGRNRLYSAKITI